MTSQYWHAVQAYAYHEFQYQFPEKTLTARTSIVAGGYGGLGAAIVAWLAPEGAHQVVSYRASRVRAEALRRAIGSSFNCSLSLVAGDIASAEVCETRLTVAQKTGRRLAGAAMFPGDSGRVTFGDLNRETIVTSLESNYVGRILSAKEIGAVMESIRSRTEKGKCQNTPAC